jgi:DNA invertase Pin-like site-specific DNA recombinase
MYPFGKFEDGILIASSRSSPMIYALDLSKQRDLGGDITWLEQLPVSDFTDGNDSRVMGIVDGVVYVERLGFLYALDSSTDVSGERNLWSYQNINLCNVYDGHSEPCHFQGVTGTNGMVYVGSNDSHICALDTSTGDLIWRFEQVVVYRLDRIGRKALVILSAWEALKQRGVALRSLTEPFDTAQPFGEFVMGILAMGAGYERDSIVSRTTDGRRRKAREGKWTGGRAPGGYRVTDGMLEVDEEEAGLVRNIFSWYTDERMSGQGIATYLNANGILTRASRRGFDNKRIKSSNHWDHIRVLSILKNETYAGVCHVGKRGKGDIISQEVPTVISRETWQTTQGLLRNNWAYAPRNAKRDYLLRGLILCGVCGRRFVGYTTNSGQGAYYNRHECDAPRIRLS